MPDLKPVTALGGGERRRVRHDALELEENASLALASLSLPRGATRPMPFGLALPGPGEWTGNDMAAAFWTGPDQWLIEGPGRAESDFAAEVARHCPSGMVTEQTDGFVAFEIRSACGEGAILALLAKLVNLDPARLRPGSATRTGFEHMSVFVIRRAPGHLAVLGMRSAAGTLWHALETAISRLAAVSSRV